MTGVGLAWRPEFAPHREALAPHVDCVELLVDDWIALAGVNADHRAALALDVPRIAHCTALSVGSAEPAPAALLARLREVLAELDVGLLSEHLSWSVAGEYAVPNFFGVLRDERSLEACAAALRRIRERTGVAVAVENVVTFLDDPAPRLDPARFLAELAERADVGLLLDVNNLYVDAVNGGFDPYAFVDAIPGDRVAYLHVAGHARIGPLLVDSHEDPVHRDVWDLLAYALRRTSAAAVVLERDNRSATLPELVSELQAARAVWRDARRRAG